MIYLIVIFADYIFFINIVNFLLDLKQIVNCSYVVQYII